MAESETRSPREGDVAMNPLDELAASAGTEHPRFLRWMIFAAIAGLAAGVTSWGIGDAFLNTFKTPLSAVQIGPITLMQATTPSTNATNAKNATLTFVILGTILGLFLGAAGGILRAAPLRAVLAGFAGIILGGLSAGLASWPLLGIYYRQHVPDPNDLLFPLLVLGGIWSVIGAAGGLAFCLGGGGSRHLLNAASSAFLGVLLATVVYEVIGITVFPDSHPTDPLTLSSPLRMLARVLVCTSAAVGAAMASYPVRGARLKPDATSAELA